MDLFVGRLPIQKTQEDISNNVPPVYTFGDFNTSILNKLRYLMPSITWENHKKWFLGYSQKTKPLFNSGYHPDGLTI